MFNWMIATPLPFNSAVLIQAILDARQDAVPSTSQLSNARAFTAAFPRRVFGNVDRRAADPIPNDISDR
jgi:hypothetical protein